MTSVGAGADTGSSPPGAADSGSAQPDGAAHAAMAEGGVLDAGQDAGRSAEAGLRARPDGGYAAPCDPETGLWQLHADDYFFADQGVTQGAVYIVNFPTRTIAGSAPMTNPSGIASDNWTATVDPAELAGGPTCDELHDDFMVIVGRDAQGEIQGAHVEDSIWNDTFAFTSIEGGIADCRGSFNLRAQEVTATTRVDLFAWDPLGTSLSAPTPAQRMDVTSNTETHYADFTVSLDSLPLCQRGHPIVYIIVDHEQDEVEGVYAASSR